MLFDEIFSDKSILRKQNISIQELKNMRMEELIPLILLVNIFGYIFLNEEILNTKQSTEKMKLLSESSGYICIDTSKMEYVEDSNDTFGIC